MTIDKLLQKTDDIKQQRIEEGAVTNFLGNVANKLIKGQSFAQSNMNRAQKALDKQAKKDAFNAKALDQAIQVTTMLDKSNIKVGTDSVSSIGKDAVEVIEYITEFKDIYKRVAEDEDFKKQDLSALKTAATVLNNATKSSNSVAGTIITIVHQNSDIYDKSYKNKGLAVFLKDYKDGKIATTAKGDALDTAVKKLVPTLVAQVLKAGVPANDLFALAGGL